MMKKIIIGFIKFLALAECTADKYSIIEDGDTKICYVKNGNKNCPNDYPLYYNGKCYKNCPYSENTKPNPYEQKCECRYNWYQEGDALTCLPRGIDCPINIYPLKVFSTNECKTENNMNLIEFNYTLYSSCPEKTKPEGISCICDPNKKWYINQTEEGRTYYYCDQGCPNDKTYQKEGDK